MAKTVGVVLSGCGVFDGSEIHEATLTLYFLSRAGLRAVCFAPDKPQLHVVDHLRRSPVEGERRNVRVESARIARGEVEDLATARADALDALILPGGYGAAKNLSTYAVDGADCTVDPALTTLLREMHRLKKPIGALCISPVILGRLFGADHAPRLTVGVDPAAETAVATMGAKAVPCAVGDVVVDEAHRILTTPCYQSARTIAEVGAGVEALVGALSGLLGAAR